MHTLPKPEYGIVIAKDIMVPMRDGVRLATDIYRPAHDGEPVPGKFPVVLGRTSYDKNAEWLWGEPIGKYFCRRGYVVAIQDLRGRHGSEGTGQYFHTANPTEGPDGFDTVEWLAAQPWCNGKIGTVGNSHGGMVQTCMALYRPPHLKAICPDVSPISSYHHMSREGGAMQMQMFGAQFLHAHDAQELRDNPAGKRAILEAMDKLRDWIWKTPFKPGHTPLAVVPNLEKTLFDYYYRGAYDDFWKQDCVDYERHFDRHADVPGLHTGGWYDPFAMGTVNYFAAMRKQNQSPQRLIMGPWFHGSMWKGFTYAGDVDFGPAASMGLEGYNNERIRWFERWLRDQPIPVENDPPVRIFIMGGGDGRRNADGRLNHGGQWRSEKEWPLARTKYTPWYLQAGGRLAASQPDSSAPCARFTFDPAHPVPTIAGNVCAMYELAPLVEGVSAAVAEQIPTRLRMRSIVMAGAAHQKEAPGIVGCQPPYPALCERADVLVFQTPPLEQDIEVTGVAVVKLWISSSALDTDFTAKLLDVYPPSRDYPHGYHMNLADSILRVRYRNSWEKEELLKPGEVAAIEIPLSPTSNLFKAGHRIRIDISSSNFPRFDLNPNTGEPMGRHTHTVVAHNVVYLDRARPSQVVLPVIG